MQITEIYKSLQGESTYAGLPCVFIRLTGCNLRCTWCDSEFSFYGGYKMSADEIAAEVQKLHAQTGDRQLPTGKCLVEITGGEPMLQEREVVPLMQRLITEGYKVLVETSGERPLAAVPKEVIKIVDVKCPHSGEPDTFAMENLNSLQPHDELKFVLADRIDYEFARDFVRLHNIAAKVNAILFSPAFEKDAMGARDASHCLLDPQQLAEWILTDNVPARLSLQLHKFIWDPAAKSV
ncbi:MAG TPA: radical SAM protein [Terriglobales bacterium]|nr:radical SAM protein [Terriglobales bacterium]